MYFATLVAERGVGDAPCFYCWTSGRFTVDV